MVDFEFATNLGDFALPTATKERKTTNFWREIRGWVGANLGANGRRNTWDNSKAKKRNKVGGKIGKGRGEHGEKTKEKKEGDMITYKLEKKHVQFHLVPLQLFQLSLLSP
jgi:hypothetical protein